MSKPKKPRNFVAKTLADPKFRPQVSKSKKRYIRKGRHVRPFEFPVKLLTRTISEYKYLAMVA